MDPGEILAEHGWHLLAGSSGALLLASVVLWVTGHEPLAGLAFVLGLTVPLAVLGVALDGQ